MNANTVTSEHVGPLCDRVREHAARLMGAEKAAQLAKALGEAHGPRPTAGSGHRLASDAAAKLLASGKLRQAEKAYKELVEKHGDISSYVGLAHTLKALEDEPAALTTLRDGAASFAKKNDRATAVSLLAEAVALAPGDLSAHRRLAAALANQGDLVGAVEEYGRFVDVALTTGDSRRALLELAYGRETLGDLPGLAALVDRVTASHSRSDAPQPPARQPARPAVTRPVIAVAAEAPRPPSVAHTAPAPSSTVVPQPTAMPAQRPLANAPTPPPPAAPTLRPSPAAAAPLATPLTARTRPDLAAHTAVVLNGASTVTHAEETDLSAPVDVLARAGVLRKNGAPAPVKPQRPKMDIEAQLAALMTTGTGIEAATVAASRAALLTGAHDARATDAVLDAARRLLALGKLQSASDVLLDFIGHGFTDREAQRLLIEVNCALGRRDVAKEKCTLLSQAYRLDGKVEVADDVERLARIL